jgi:hypothetical protein
MYEKVPRGSLPNLPAATASRCVGAGPLGAQAGRLGVDRGPLAINYPVYHPTFLKLATPRGQSPRSPIGAWAGSQPWIARAERSGLLTHIAATEKQFIVRADEKLTAFLELESEGGTRRAAVASSPQQLAADFAG